MAPTEGFIQAESLMVSDPEAIKVILHPLRTRIITALSQEPLTVKELAEAVGMEQTKLYYHIKLLLKAGIIVAAAERHVGNLTETSYICGARDISIDPALALNAGTGGSAEKTVNTFVSALRSSLVASCRRLGRMEGVQDAASPPPRSLGMSMETLKLMPGEAEEFSRRIKELITEYDMRNSGAAGADTYEIGYAIYPGPAPRRKGS